MKKCKVAIKNSTDWFIDGSSPPDEVKRFFGMDDGTYLSRNAALNSAAYYACMQIRCNAIAKLPLKLMQQTEDGIEKRENHPLYYLLSNRPNPYTNAHDFLWATEFQRLDTGNAYWVIQTERGRPKGIYLLDSKRISIIIDDAAVWGEENAVYYQYSDIKKGEIVYTADSIVHFRNFAADGIQGTSIRSYMSDIIMSENHAARIVSEKYRTGLQDPIIITYTGDLNEAKGFNIQKKFAGLGGVKNAGKVIPIPTDFNVSTLETKLVNSQFFELQGLNTRRIANAFGVKGFQLNDMEKSTYNNIEQQNRAFYSDTLQNVLTTYEQEIDYVALTRKEKRERYFVLFNVDAILRSDIETRTRAHNEAINGGWKTRAEVRKMEGLPYLPNTERLSVQNGAAVWLDDLGKAYDKLTIPKIDTDLPEKSDEST